MKNEHNSPVPNNYWKTLSKTPRFYTVWPGGWEIHVRVEKNKVYGHGYGNLDKPRNKEGYVINKKGEVVYHTQVIFDIPRSCPRVTRAALKVTVARDKRIAQAVQTQKEYRELWDRIDDENWEYIESNDLQGHNLVHWAYNTRTAQEYYNLLRYN